MKSPVTRESLDELRFDAVGLIPVVAQDRTTGAVLMLAWASREALEASLATRRMTYWSRSRQRLWTKGEESGNVQQLVGLYADCDLDALLALVDQRGPACHEGTGSCWSSSTTPPVATLLGALDALAAERQGAPAGGYTDRLLADAAFAAAKVQEEGQEVGQVLRGEANDDSLEHEAADLLYHLVVALRAGGSDLGAVLGELRKREG